MRFYYLYVCYDECKQTKTSHIFVYAAQSYKSWCLLIPLSLKVLSIHFSLLDYSQRSRQLLKCVKLEERSEARITNRKYISFDDDARRSLVGLLDVDVSPVRVYLYAVYVVLT